MMILGIDDHVLNAQRQLASEGNVVFLTHKYESFGIL